MIFFYKFIYTIKPISEETLGVVMAKHGFKGEESEMWKDLTC